MNRRNSDTQQREVQERAASGAGQRVGVADVGGVAAQRGIRQPGQPGGGARRRRRQEEAVQGHRLRRFPRLPVHQRAKVKEFPRVQEVDHVTWQISKSTHACCSSQLVDKSLIMAKELKS